MPAAPRKAMILAAGYGTRMRAYNNAVPKPLVPVLGKPLIDWSLDLLAQNGVEEAVVNVSYMAEQLVAHLQAYPQLRVHISHEEAPLETGGGIAHALPLLGDAPFFVLNSDVICHSGSSAPFLQRLAAHWDDANMDALLLVTDKQTASGYSGKGDFFISDKGALQRRGEADEAPLIFSGIQLLHPRFFAHAPANETTFSLNVLYDHGIAADGTLHRVKGLVHDGTWLHVGDGEGVRSAEQRLQKIRGRQEA